MSSSQPSTISGFLANAVTRRGDERALGSIRGGELRWRTWRQVAADAQTTAAAIDNVGVRPGDRVAHLSENRYEWIITDLALHLAGAVHVPIHVTLSPPQIVDQITHSGAKLLLVSNESWKAKLAGELPAALPIFVHDDRVLPPLGGKGRGGGASATPTIAAPAETRDVASRDLVSPPTASPHDLATILYTSGTTGQPRGVMLSQQNLASNAAAVAELHGGDADQTRLCVLPLSHIYARTCDLYTWVYRGSRLVLAESRDTLARDCRLAQPRSLSAVPYIYERIAERIRDAAPPDEPAALRGVFGENIERLSCGGAPLPPHFEAWYAERGLPVLPGYGLTETSPVVAMSTLDTRRAGTVGRPLPNVDVRIAADGEILVRGTNVMLGYWQDSAATAEAIRDGWLHTGDLGHLDDDGFLSIAGRKKELLVLSTGKNVFPTRVEVLLTASPLIEQAAVFGDGLPALVALIVATSRGSADGTTTPAATRDTIEGEIQRCLADAAHEEQVRAFTILDRPFTVDRGELTPKLSLCRETIARNFAAQLAKMHSPIHSVRSPRSPVIK